MKQFIGSDVPVTVECTAGFQVTFISGLHRVFSVRCPNKELLRFTEEGTNDDVFAGTWTSRSCCYIALDNGEKTRQADVTLLVFITAFLTRRT